MSHIARLAFVELGVFRGSPTNQPESLINVWYELGLILRYPKID